MINLLIIAFLLIPFQQALAEDSYQEWKIQALAEMSKKPVDEAGTMSFAYRTFSPQVRLLMNTRISESDSFMVSHSADPVLWYIRGWLGRRTQSFYYDDLQKEGKAYNRYAPENQALIKEYQSYYRKALDLDDNPDAPDHLDHYMLTAIGTDVLASPDLKEKAMKKKVMLTQQGNVIHPNQEWQSYEFLLGNYAEQKDYDNYLKTVNEMIERFPGSPRMEELLEYKRQAEAAIGKRDREAAIADAYAQAEPYAEVSKAALAAEPYTALEKVVKEVPKVEPSMPVVEAPKQARNPAPEVKSPKPVAAEAEKKDSNLVTVLIAGGAALLILIGWLALRRKETKP
ncbi:MAG: hypothetical protein CO186_02615 [Zetaproteobacteria bacterium CG_4_9_14_3_um_filter_49_83]|nr:MAG: hypothetical protein CO186_02615 [Zetaproteobacteria bacterium CG_4_9_14_3_um_filter_49_83]